MEQTEQYQPSIFDKMIEPMNRYMRAKTLLQMLEKETPIPKDYSLRKTQYQVQMRAAELDMKELIGIKDK